LSFVEHKYKNQADRINHTDGLSMEMTDWRFNLRPSNTESLLRLNLETRGLKSEVQKYVSEIEEIIFQHETALYY
jgi:phosphomannomutase